MPIAQSSIVAAARSAATQRKLTKQEATGAGFQTAFLCHSHKDSALAPGLVKMLTDNGWKVYVDWADPSMPETPSRITADRIKSKIVESYWFLFLATANSMSSRWCPWEIGYADGRKPIDRLLIIPTTDMAGISHGSEYLELYRKVDLSEDGSLAVWTPGSSYSVRVRFLTQSV